MLESKNQSIINDSKDAYSKLIASNEDAISTKSKLEEAVKEKEELSIRVRRLELEKRTADNIHKNSVKQQDEIITENAQLKSENAVLKQEMEEIKAKLQELERIQSERATEKTQEEYFELHNKYESALSALDSYTLANEKLQRRLNDQESLYIKSSEELQEHKEKSRTLQKTIKEQEIDHRELKFNLDKVLSDRSNLLQEKKKVEATLKDTTYQLQHILFDMEKRQISIPSSVDVSSEVTIVPSLEHEQLVFTSVAELQGLNVKLSEQLRALNEEAATVKDVSDRFINETHAKTLDEATDTILKLEELLSEKQKELEVFQEKFDKQHNRAEQDKTTDFSSQALKESLDKLKETADMLTVCRSEMTEEVNKLKDELCESHRTESKARNDAATYRTELAQLKKKNMFLTNTTQQKENELSTARNDANLANNQLIQKEKMISQIQDWLAEYKLKTKKLEHENKLLQGQLRAQTESYELIKKELASVDAEKLHLSNLLKNMNAHVEGLRHIFNENAESAKEQNKQLSSELQSCHVTISSLEKELELSRSVDSQEKQKEVESLKEKMAELEQKLSTANQEKIIAETKLSEAEESSKNTAAGDDSDTKNFCEDHIKLIAELKDQIRVLEDEKTKNAAAIEEINRKIVEDSDKYKKSIEEANTKAEKLSADIEQRMKMTSESQQLIQKIKEEYNSLSGKLQESQTKIALENQALKSEKKNLENQLEEIRQQIEILNGTIEEQKQMHEALQVELHIEKETHQQVKGTTKKTQQDLINLQSELDESKRMFEDVKSQLESKVEKYQSETKKWSEIQEKLNKEHKEVEKNHQMIDTHIEELFEKLSKWSSSDQNQTDPTIAEFTKEIYVRLSEANATLLREKEAINVNYFEECRKYRLLEEETLCIRDQLNIARKKANGLEKIYNDLSKEKSIEVKQYKLEVDAFKKQNTRLVSTNSQLKIDFEKTKADLQKNTEEFGTMALRVKALETQLRRSEEKVKVYIEKEKQWTTKSAELESKYDAKEAERIKTETETMKKELEATKTELQNLRSSTLPLNDKIKSLEAELENVRSNQTAIVSNASQKQRLALELKNRLSEANKKNAELESTIADLQKQIKEAPNKPSVRQINHSYVLLTVTYIERYCTRQPTNQGFRRGTKDEGRRTKKERRRVYRIRGMCYNSFQTFSQ